MWQRSTLFLVTLAIMGVVVRGQSDDPDSKSAWGYFYGGVGGVVGEEDSAALLHFGGGGEALFVGGFGAAFDLGYLAPASHLGSGIGVLSPGLVYAFNRNRRTVPFVTGGYTLFFRESGASGVYFGGGVNRWFSPRFGFRVEGRDQVLVEHNIHFGEVRFSLLVR